MSTAKRKEWVTQALVRYAGGHANLDQTIEEVLQVVGLADSAVRECRWTEDADIGVWETGCGDAHVFMEGAPSDNNFAHCPYCGARLVEIRQEASDDTE